MRILISACLLGVPCKYSGGSNLQKRLPELLKDHTLIPVCPELYGGLPIPRPPAEKQGDRVVDRQGKDVTQAFVKGAEKTLAMAREFGCTAAILKENSPSCGCGQVYDGTFTDVKIPGNGLTAQLLLEHNISVWGESQISEFLSQSGKN